MYIDFFLMTLFGGIYNIYTSKNYCIILEDFYNLFICRRFRGYGKNEVMIWQPCLFLRSAASCYHCHSSWLQRYK